MINNPQNAQPAETHLSRSAGQTSATPRLRGPFTGWHMLAIMVGFFGVIIVVNFYMAFMATGTWTGMIVKNSYVASQKFNENLDELAMQQAQGWQSALGYVDEGIELTLVDADGAPVALTNVVVLVGRPAHEHLDQQLTMTEIAPGRYRSVIRLDQGPWMLQLTADAVGHPYRLERRLFIGSDGADVGQ